MCIPLFYIAGAGSVVFWIIGTASIMSISKPAVLQWYLLKKDPSIQGTASQRKGTPFPLFLIEDNLSMEAKMAGPKVSFFFFKFPCNSSKVTRPYLSLPSGASVVVVLLHAGCSAQPTHHKTVDEELGLVMEEVTIS